MEPEREKWLVLFVLTLTPVSPEMSFLKIRYLIGCTRIDSFFNYVK